jgi:hypothetical protein
LRETPTLFLLKEAETEMIQLSRLGIAGSLRRESYNHAAFRAGRNITCDR